MNGSRIKALAALTLLILTLTACGPTTETEEMMIAWAGTLNAHLASGGTDGTDYSFPHKLGQVDEMLTAGLSRQDAWGQKFLYRRLRDDKYQMISAGEDGEYGNEDDIVVENGVTYDPVEIYAKRPLKKR